MIAAAFSMTVGTAWAQQVGINGAPCQYSTLGDALAAVTPGDTLYLRDGYVFAEGDLTLLTDVTLTTGGPSCGATVPLARAVIDGDYASGPLVVPAGVTVSLVDVDVIEHSGVLGGNFHVAGTLVARGYSRMGYAEAEAGGGVYVSSGGVLELHDRVELSFNNADEGGGVYVEAGGTLQMFDSALLTVNGALVCGGGVYTEGTVDVTDFAEIEGNFSDGDGGGICARGTLPETVVVVGDTTMRLNSALGSGGAVYALAGSGTTRVELLDTLVDGNVADGDGGAVWSDGSLTITDAAVQFNSSRFGSGGGIAGGGTVVLVDTRVGWNDAAVDGGGIHLTVAGTLSVEGGSVDGNTAANDGGGVSLDGELSAAFDGVGMLDNVAVNGGGGLYLRGPIDVELIGVLVQDNEAGGDGGGVLVASDEVNVPTLRVDGPRDPLSSTCLSSYGTVGVGEYCSEFRSNSAARGGGLLARAGVVDLDRTAFLANSASNDGLAINLIGDDAPVLTATNVLVAGHSGSLGQNVVRAGTGATLDARHVTLAGNPGGLVGVRYAAGSTGQLVRSIVWGADLAVNTGVSLPASCTSYDTLSVGTLSGGSIAPAQDPLFVNPGVGDFRLQTGLSPGSNACGSGHVVDLMSTARTLPSSRGAFE